MTAIVVVGKNISPGKGGDGSAIAVNEVNFDLGIISFDFNIGSGRCPSSNGNSDGRRGGIAGSFWGKINPKIVGAGGNFESEGTILDWSTHPHTHHWATIIGISESKTPDSGNSITLFINEFTSDGGVSS